jgi:spermidine synthase
MKRPVHIFASLGFTSTVGQVLLMRELIVVFYGNELSLGIMLGAWLFWAGVGSLLAATVATRLKVFSHLSALAVLQALLGIASVGSLMCVRILPVLVRGSSSGEIIGYIPMLISSFLVLAPMCLLFGFLFDLFCHMWSGDGEAVSTIGSVYIFEGLGAALGGIAFAAVFIRIFDPVETMCALLALNLASAAAILAVRGPFRPATIAFSIAAIAATTATFFGGAERLREHSLGWLWGKLEVTRSEDSIYGNLTLVEKEEEKSLYENGLLMFSNPDRFSAEEAVHFALLEHPLPERVLLIGGGVNGSLNEVLKHPVKRVDYLELDPSVIEMVRRFFPSEICAALEDPRVDIRHIDGRLFVKETDRTYDVVIVNLPDPNTAMINRFYTLEFFGECLSKMAPGGILSFRVSSAENYISPELQQFLGCLDKTLGRVFADVKVVPGESNIFLACNRKGVLTLDADVLVERLDQRGIKEKLLFIREYYLPYRLSEDRVEKLVSALATAEARINTDLSPVCYYYHAVLWSKQFEDVSGTIIASFARVRPYWIFVVISAITVAGLLIQRLFPMAWGPKSILAVVATTGFAEISIEVVALLGFQAIHGYVYYKVAIIITAFMVGLTAGAALMNRAIARSSVGRRALLLIQLVVCVYPMIMLGVLILFTRAGSSGAGANTFALQAQVAFPLLAFLAGLVGGLQFPLANDLWLSEMPGAARAAGYTYGADLLGSCLGALLTTALLVPVLGIPFACMTASALNLGSLLLLLFRPRSA